MSDFKKSFQIDSGRRGVNVVPKKTFPNEKPIKGKERTIGRPAAYQN